MTDTIASPAPDPELQPLWNYRSDDAVIAALHRLAVSHRRPLVLRLLGHECDVEVDGQTRATAARMWLLMTNDSERTREQVHEGKQLLHDTWTAAAKELEFDMELFE